MKVDLLIIGAARSGTTTVYSYLKEHKQINFSNIKEIHFFSVKELYNRGQKYYHSFFKKTNNPKIFASADTYLFIDKNAQKRILKYNSQMKFIVMLREPVSRAFSGYKYAINNGYLKKKISFIEAIKNEKKFLNSTDNIVKQNNLCNAYQSLYYENLKYWFKFFPQKNFLILKTHELDNPKKLLKKISDFLKISDFPILSDKRKANKASSVKSKKLEQVLLNRNTFPRKLARKIIPQCLKNRIFKSGIVDKIHKANKTDKNKLNISLSKEDKVFAKEYFKEDLDNLQKNFRIDF